MYVSLASGGFVLRPNECSAPGPHWGISVSRLTPHLSPLCKFLPTSLYKLLNRCFVVGSRAKQRIK